MALPTWTTAISDWESRIIERRSLVPPPLFPEEAAAARAVFDDLMIVDAVGSPTMGEACRPWALEFVDAVFGSYNNETGRRLIREFFLSIGKKNSKALALDTEVATPYGFKTIADLRVGDQVIDATGNPTPVTGKSEVFTGRVCYEVRFSTGERVVCDAEHLWVTDDHLGRQAQRKGVPAHQRNEAARQPKPTTKTTAEIAATLKVKSGQSTINNHRTAVAGALRLPKQDGLPIPPYALGLWLGDGHSRSGRITAGADVEHELLELLSVSGQPAYTSYRRAPANDRCKGSVLISLTDPATRNHSLPYRFQVAASRLGLLGDKHIPRQYLRSSIDQRLLLLRGLMDADGSISAKGQAVFGTTSRRLRDDVRELVCSLGLKASVSEHRATLNARDCGPCWTVQFWPFADTPVFGLRRKFTRQRVGQLTNAPRSRTRQITAVTLVGSVPTQCISVASKTRQFLITRSFVPTHNSTLAAGIMITALIRNWRKSAEFLIVAPTIEVANNSFGPAFDMIRNQPELQAILHTQEHYRTIIHKVSRATLKVIAADNEAVSGKKAVGVLIDELWLFGKRKGAENMLREATGGLASRPEGFVIYLSTQSDEPPTGIFKQKLDYFRDVRDGKVVDKRSLPVIYEYPRNMIDNEEFADPTKFYIPNPNLGASVDPEFLESEFEKAQLAGQQSLVGFYAKHLNVELGMNIRSNRWPGVDYWQRSTDKTLTRESLLERSEVVVIGLDGGGLSDLFGLAMLGREYETKRWLLWSHAWCHHSVFRVWKTIAEQLEGFRRSGELTVVDDDLDDIQQIVSIVEDVMRRDLLGGVAVDPAGIGQMVDALAEIDVTQESKLLVGIGQGYRMMSAIKTAERKLANGSLVHSASRMMDWNIGNLKIESTATAIRATKQNAGDAKIDAAMAFFNCVDLMSLNPESNSSIYTTNERSEGLLVL